MKASKGRRFVAENFDLEDVGCCGHHGQRHSHCIITDSSRTTKRHIRCSPKNHILMPSSSSIDNDSLKEDTKSSAYCSSGNKQQCQEGVGGVQRQRGRRRRRRHSSSTSSWFVSALPLLCWMLLLHTCLHHDDNDNSRLGVVSASSTTTTTAVAADQYYLNQDSVVLITGAAGFLASELAMALHRVYKVKKIICVDSMQDMIGLAGSSKTTEEDLALFEYKRQRAFHLQQTLGKVGVFYRADFTPSIPEYFDQGEVPILDYLSRDYSAITHVVHLAESKQDQAVPRHKEDVSSGMMEALLEQLLKFDKTPHFVYASSYEVYNHLHPSPTINPVPFTEDQPITTPSSLRGASKLIDELLAKAYYETNGIFSVGLRFFSVYGPWGVPGSTMFEMAERAVTEAPIVTRDEMQVVDDVRDYIYIQDAVDALMAAMQYTTLDGAPLVINVGSGQGTSLKQVATMMEELLPRANNNINDAAMKDNSSSSSATVSYANTDRARLLLGFQPRVSLKDGLIKLLSWHYDRAFPYGGRPASDTKDKAIAEKRNYIASQGIVSCSPFDKECLRGAPVFPCSSECSHESKCTTSVYDDVFVFTRFLTAKCPTVMYTLDLSPDLEAIPSANMAISTHHSSHLEDGCNIAFVSESSTLVKTLKKEQGFSVVITAVETFMKYASSSRGKNVKVLKHGFWTLVPVSTPNFETGDEHIHDLLPKLSPGLFFGQVTTHAIYCDPHVVFKDIPTLLQEAKMQPYRADTPGATAMLVARKRTTPVGHSSNRRGDDRNVISARESIQNAAYRMVRIGVIDEIMTDDGSPHPLVDSSWIVHMLQNEDSRLFRCDIFGEVVQWNVPTDETAFEFIMGLHDMWSRVIVREREGVANDPWWIGDRVITVPQDYNNNNNNNGVSSMRRLQQKDDDDVGTDNADSAERDNVAVDEPEEGDNGDDGADIDATNEDDNQEQEAAEAVAENVSGDAEQADDNDQEPDSLEAGDVPDDDKEEVVVLKDMADEQAENEDEDDDTNDNEDVDQVGDIDPKALLDAKTDDQELSDSEDDAEDVESEKDEAFANKKPAVDELNVDDLVAKENQAADKSGVDSGGFLNAGNVRVEVAERPQGGDGGEQQDSEEEDEIKSVGDSENDEEDEDGQPQVKVKLIESAPERDPSSYDSWMGVLSSTSVHYFVRIVSSSEVGATYLDDYKY